MCAKKKGSSVFGRTLTVFSPISSNQELILALYLFGPEKIVLTHLKIAI